MWWPTLAAISGEAAYLPAHPQAAPVWLCHVPTPALCAPRNDRLWICMEFCGGGSLQEIYHGEGQDSRPQRATGFFPSLPQHRP